MGWNLALDIDPLSKNCPRQKLKITKWLETVKQKLK
jgi:hypothetical protein